LGLRTRHPSLPRDAGSSVFFIAIASVIVSIEGLCAHFNSGGARHTSPYVSPQTMGCRPTRPWAEIEAKAAETATTCGKQWSSPLTRSISVRCTFLGPLADGASPAVRITDLAGRSISSREQVRFLWEISVPDAPAGFSSKETVGVRADHVFDQAIPVPDQWDAVLPIRKRLKEAWETASAQSPGHECTVLGICLQPVPALGQRTHAGPRAGSQWAFRESGGRPVAVWVAGRITADEWWCVKALFRRTSTKYAQLSPRKGKMCHAYNRFRRGASSHWHCRFTSVQ